MRRQSLMLGIALPLALGVFFAMLPVTEDASAGGAEQILYSFQRGTDGLSPYSTLIADKAGNLYGTTIVGGAGCKSIGCGTVFEIAPDGMETILHAFGGFGGNGTKFYLGPRAGLVADKAGNVYGTTQEGGKGSKCGNVGCGTVFKLSPDGTEMVLYVFQGVNNGDGEFPYAGLLLDKEGNLYGTTANGGNKANCQAGCGTVFEVAPDGTETVLYSFQGGSDGSNPHAGLLADKSGDLYGTTTEGGGDCNCGTVFELAPDGTETVLYAFKGGLDGANPYAGLIEDSAANFYSTTASGGAHGSGTVFKLTPDGVETLLYVFLGVGDGGTDGEAPYASLVEDRAGNFYGTTEEGGTGICSPSTGCGTVFRIAPDGTETLLHKFVGGSDGGSPYGALLLGKSGELFGTTTVGGGDCNCGTVFEVKK